MNQELKNQICEKAHSNQHKNLRNRKQIVPQLIHKSDIIQGEVIIYFLSSSEVTYSLCDRGVRLENHFLSPIMYRKQPESMSYLSSRPPSSTSESESEMFLEDLAMRQWPVKSPCLRLTFSSSSELEESSLEKSKSPRA
jgi:hypothetical protein